MPSGTCGPSRRSPPLFAAAPDAVAPHARRSPSAARSRSTNCATSIPKSWSPPGLTPLEHLAAADVGKAPRTAIPAGIPDKVRRLIEHELALIAELRYEAYFLTVWDLVRFARDREHPVPGPRLGGQLGRLLLPRRDQRRSRPHRRAVRAVHQHGAERGPRYRRRFRARAARGSAAVPLRQVRPRAGRHDGRRHHLSHQAAPSATSARRSACRSIGSMRWPNTAKGASSTATQVPRRRRTSTRTPSTGEEQAGESPLS